MKTSELLAAKSSFEDNTKWLPFNVHANDTAGIIKRLFNKWIAQNVRRRLCAAISDESDMECVVTEIIHQIGIPAHIKGYHYLRTAIMLSVEDPDMINCITKLLYPTVARMYETTPSRVERAIRHAIEIAWDRGDVDTLNSYFGYTIHTSRGKPTNSEFVALIADKLRLKYRCTAIYGSKRMKNSPEDSVVRI